MVIKSKVVDLSYFLHLEATCDSEAGYFDPAMPAVINHDHNDDNDDAESYSCEYDTTSDLHMVIELNYISDDHANVGGDDEEDGEVVDQEVCLYNKCRCDPCTNGRVAKESKKSSVHSTKTMNEMEKKKNRLFWKACLAS
ncbi:hypothetical protein V6N13_060962 [Hibiscus sabdariffa]